MEHACGLRMMRRGGFLVLALGFALLASSHALTLFEAPAILERDRQMREFAEVEAEFKGGSWKAGAWERELQRAGSALSATGSWTTLLGFTFLVVSSAWNRQDPDNRRILLATGILAGFFILSIVVKHVLWPMLSPASATVGLGAARALAWGAALAAIVSVSRRAIPVAAALGGAVLLAAFATLTSIGISNPMTVVVATATLWGADALFAGAFLGAALHDLRLRESRDPMPATG